VDTFQIEYFCTRPVGASHISQTYHNENNDNIRNKDISGTVGNCKSQYNLLSYHGPETVLRDQYVFPKMQVRILEISEYIPGFSDCVDGMIEKKYVCFSYEKIRKYKIASKYVVILYANKFMQH
jgi:hypothetical protein